MPEIPENLCTISTELALKLGCVAVPTERDYTWPPGLHLMLADRYHGYRLLWKIDSVLERDLRRGRLTSR